jgi:DNA-binding response OmpR family regulator
MPEKTILIIDDDPHFLLGLTPRLEANRYNVLTATGAASGMAMAQREFPNLIILDLRLPAVSDGWHLLQKIRSTAELTKTPLIVLSSADAADNEKRALDAGRRHSSRNPPSTMNCWPRFGESWENHDRSSAATASEEQGET